MDQDAIYIHVGYHKSASTYLQQNVFPTLPANYLFLAGDKRRILDGVLSQGNFDRDVLLAWVRGQVHKISGPRGNGATVLSHEELSGHPHGYRSRRNDPFSAAANLKRTFPNARIFIVIRNQLDYMLSLYTFRVAIKGEESRKLSRFLREEGPLGLFDKLAYDRLIAHYIRLFGRKNVLVLPMEMLRTNACLFHENLADFFTVPRIPFKVNRPVNKSTKVAAVVNFWRPVNRAFAGVLRLRRLMGIDTRDAYPDFTLRYRFYGLKQKGTRRLNQLLGSMDELSILSTAVGQEVVPGYAESNRRLEKLTGLDLKRFGYPI